MIICRLILFTILLASATAAYAGDGFGRFFTTPAEREYLDQLRDKKMNQQPVVNVPKIELAKKKKPVEKSVSVDAIKLKGLVYRKDGKSTAWINEGNSYQGDIGSQYTRVKSGKIKPDHVSIDFSGSDSEIKLRVGQSYLPAKKAVRDVIGSQNDK
jgi:hypothetical protein